jgi:uncharacterized protein (DUF305 family)
MINHKPVFGVLAAGVAALLLAGCGGTSTPATDTATPATAASSGPTTVSAAHNAADITFAQQMIPHHQQAVAMAQLAADRAANDEVKQLATRIQGAQDPEITQMQSFLTAWGATAAAPTGDMGGMHDAGGTMSAMPGMLSDNQMSQLRQATGAPFDRAFLQMMTAHHQGAIQMAQTELADGQNPDAKALAQKIITAQQGEITQMRTLLGS